MVGGLQLQTLRRTPSLFWGQLLSLDVKNGDVITSRQLQNGRYGPLGVSVDSADDIFVCVTPNIVVLSGDLKNEHVLCNLGDKGLLASAYDDKKHQLII